ncbi:PREDICTED: lysine-rich nucleolar protein 1 [Chrysochloris asiatica]|uniref:Lysine-rich nucleolar protein 1 n=1 Tax=Chrysochloris asiatica TaxID=185453 RepID=A0A9B0X2D7_CHRAS|nr:PREDICTED: lysine-rich nucleolar protein 1 [Chrysochloris asiatica]
MIPKTQQAAVDLGLPEKKKKKKKIIKEPESQYFTEVSPRRSASPSKNGVQTPGMPVVKKKKKKKVVCENPLEHETVLQTKWADKSSSSRKQALGLAEFQSGEKRKKRGSWSAVTPLHGQGTETPLSPKEGEEGIRVAKKLKKHRKEKKAQHAMASAQSQGLCEGGYAHCIYEVGKTWEELAASGQKQKQGSQREARAKMKKTKKIYQEGDLSLNHLKISKTTRSSSRKGSKKKAAKSEVLDYIPIGDSLKAPVKKKIKCKKQEEQPGIEESARKRKKKKKRKESQAAEHCEEEPDSDLEVVLEKKGNMDEVHIDQVRRKALQEEIDRESGKTEASETTKWTGTKFGQWDTADFENEDQKLKFLKLMGGFKNLSPSFSRPPGMMGRSNMALNKKAADSLQQNLQQDYERAMSWKYSRGAGLGFSRAPDKVFYIDRNASKSIKFED